MGGIRMICGGLKNQPNRGGGGGGGGEEDFEKSCTVFYTSVLVLCHVAAVKSLPIHHHSAGNILFPMGSLSPRYFENTA